MKPTFVKSSVSVAVAMLVSFASGSFAAESGEYETEMSTAVVDEAELTNSQHSNVAATEKAVNCWDNACYGKYENLVHGLDVRKDGLVIIFPTQEVSDAVAQSSLGCGRPQYLFLQFAGPFDEKQNAAVGRLINQLMLAKALGSTLLIVYEQSGNSLNDCRVSRITLYD